MTATNPRANKKSADHKRPGKTERQTLTETGGRDKTAAIDQVASSLDAFERLVAAARTIPGFEGAAPEHASSPREDKEMAQIYERIDRELAVEEARADRLLQRRARN
jgi:hypothetical protein